ncbi:MAG: hypothetical protein IKJ06_02125 [Clostridia bacterium]|nr:hypothetical protein [Clostridia bacterium]
MLPLKVLYYEALIELFLELAANKGWGYAPLAFLYNSDKPEAEQLTEENFIEALKRGKLPPQEVIFLFKAVFGELFV